MASREISAIYLQERRTRNTCIFESHRFTHYREFIVDIILRVLVLSYCA